MQNGRQLWNEEYVDDREEEEEELLLSEENEEIEQHDDEDEEEEEERQEEDIFFIGEELYYYGTTPYPTAKFVRREIFHSGETATIRAVPSQLLPTTEGPYPPSPSLLVDDRPQVKPHNQRMRERQITANRERQERRRRRSHRLIDLRVDALLSSSSSSSSENDDETKEGDGEEIKSNKDDE